MPMLRRVLPPIIYEPLAGLRRRLRHGSYSGLDGLDRKLHGIMGDAPGYFVELGANDGFRQSNTLFFEQHLGWRGLLVEPALNNYLACCKNRSAGTAIFCAACVPFGYSDPVVWLTYGDLMTAPLGLDSDLPDPAQHERNARQHMDRRERPVQFPARAATLDSLLREAHAPDRIDLLSLDVEGSELAVLQGIDHGRTRFRHMVIECRELSPLQQYLAQQGYRCESRLSVHDYLFMDKAHI